MQTRTCIDQNMSEAERAMLERLEHSLGSWHDELRQRLDLTELDIRHEVRRRVDITDNVYVAARSRLADLRHAARSDLSGMCRALALEHLILDLERAYRSASVVAGRPRDSS